MVVSIGRLFLLMRVKEAIRLTPLVLAPNSPIMAVGGVGTALIIAVVAMIVMVNLAPLGSCLALMEQRLFMAMAAGAAVIPVMVQVHAIMVRAGQVVYTIVLDLAVCQGLFISVKLGTFLQQLPLQPGPTPELTPEPTRLL